MRTKTLLCLAALTAGTIASWAQSNVYSLNVVGYYNVSLLANKYALVANQLNTTNNTIAALLPAPPDGTILQKYSGGYSAYLYDATIPGWTPDGNASMNPGEGAFIKSPVATTLTFVGEVMQGSLSLTMPKGSYAIRSSMSPQSATLAALSFPAEDGDIVQIYSGGYSAFLYDATVPGWTPGNTAGPSPALGAAFFVKKTSLDTQLTWTQNFTVQ